MTPTNDQVKRCVELLWRLTRKAARRRDTLLGRAALRAADAVATELDAAGFSVAVSPGGMSWSPKQPWSSVAASDTISTGSSPQPTTYHEAMQHAAFEEGRS